MRRRWIVLVCLMLSCFPGRSWTNAQKPSSGSEKIAAEIGRWRHFIVETPAVDEQSKAMRASAETGLSNAERAAAEGRSLYALQQLASVRLFLASDQYVSRLPKESRDKMETLEKEWQKAGTELASVLSGTGLPDYDQVPVAVRAIGEVAYSEVKPYYEASLEYGKSTAADYGLAYLGIARSQLELARFCAGPGWKREQKLPQVDNLANEIEQFEDEVLSQYKAPASIEHHDVFIRTSSLIKQARELEGSGLRYGALFRYLQARLSFSKIAKATPAPVDVSETGKRIHKIEQRLAAEAVDHSLARLYLEMAAAQSASGENEAAGTIFEDVLPHYFAALQPAARKAPSAPNPTVTVTLVRWPYT